MATVNKLNVTLGYEDSSTRTYAISIAEKVATDGLAAVKQKLAALRTAAKTEGSSVQKTFVSNDGKPVNNIIKAEIVMTEEEVIL